MTNPLNGKVATFGQSVDVLEQFVGAPLGDVELPDGSIIPNLRKINEELRQSGAVATVTEGVKTVQDGVQVVLTQGNNEFTETLWSVLVTRVGSTPGKGATVRGDAGFHVDPVKPGGQIVANTGVYVWRVAGWEWLSPLPVGADELAALKDGIQIPDLVDIGDSTYARIFRTGQRIWMRVRRARGEVEVSRLSVLQELKVKALSISGAFFVSKLAGDAADVGGRGLQTLPDDPLNPYSFFRRDANGRIDESAIDKRGRVPGWIMDRWARRISPSVLSRNIRVAYANEDIGAVRTGAGVTLRVTSRRDMVACWGDSLTDGVGGGGTSYVSVLRARIAEVRAGVTVYGRGNPGRSSTDITLLQGGIAPLITLAGNSIPGAVQDVAVSAVSPSTSWRYATTGQYAYDGTLAGVAGQLIHDLTATTPNGSWVFRRTTAGAAVAVPPETPFSCSFADNLIEALCIFWLGRNNFAPLNRWSDVLRDTRAAVMRLTPIDPQYLVLSVLTTASEIRGSADYIKVINTNKSLAAEYGDRYVDVRRYLIDHGLADAGINPTAQDLTDIANDTVPVSLRSDTVHLNAAGYTVVGNYLFTVLQSKGWY